MISKSLAKVINVLPEKWFIIIARKLANGYIKRYAQLNVEGFENIDKAKGAKIFICNHLSNSDGLILNKLLKEKYDPFFIAGVKLSNDPVTNLGAKIVKTINIKPNSADKDAIMNIVKTVRAGNNILIFPEGTRSRTGSMIEAKKGILLIARLTKAEIVPIGMEGSEILLPINKDGEMAKEKWNHSKVTVRFGEPFTLPLKEMDEDKHQYDDRVLVYIMKNIAKLLPEKYRGFYS
ncbi:1-acyl-sn-glycerol-3-phosphate acyltransferase [Clostridium sp. YIM B02551]|uniref:lysophospholipid acyltransferase family protein n=1 Tax=Clostridium sp. YIM B02551 TaxID=2910679 RepID=UPI001EEA9A28|nr:lysophospholipid acyltransferase family protein [Clostridium sp. YIM B02551]